jgi:hypothetical protein
MLKYEDLKERPKELLAATGLKLDEIAALLVAFADAYAESYPDNQTMEGQARQRGKGGGNKGNLSKLEDKLLFILIYDKTYPLQTMLGLQFGLSQGRVNIWIHRLTPILQRALAMMGLTPVRDGTAVAESELVREGQADLVIDGTERRRQRPQDKTRQKEHYSGKKSPYRQKSGLGQSS